MAEVSVCMGSSCFSRGNSINAGLIQDFIDQKGLIQKVELKGCLCEGNCKNGPIIKINGKSFTNVQENDVINLLTKELEVTL